MRECRLKALLPISIAVLLLAGCGVERMVLAAHERFEKTVALEPGGSFRLENVNGRVTVEAWNQNSVQIEGEKSASSKSRLDDIKIEVEGERDQVRVRTRMPRSGFFGGGGEVDYTIRVPAGASVEVETVNGGLRLDGIGGRVRASTVNGSVHVTDAGGEVEAKTVNGSIQAGYEKLAKEGRHRFSTTNGSVTLTLPPDAAGEFDAGTVNGSISTDFPLEVSGKIGGRHLKGRLGEGRGSFNIRTVNGSVKLRKA